MVRRAWFIAIALVAAILPFAPVQPASATTTAPTGLRGSYYAKPDFTNLKYSQTDAGVNASWRTSAPSTLLPVNRFAVRWTGTVTVPTTGTYTFFVNADDGARLFVNGRSLVDRWTPGALRESSATIALGAGRTYGIRVEYYDAGGSAAVQLRWSGPGIAKQIVPRAVLAPPAPRMPAGKLWSSAATWGGTVPAAGARVTVPAGTTVVLDVSPPKLSYLQVDGTLVFAPRDLTLQADAIMVHGALKVGTAAVPFQHRARIVLTGSDPTQNVMGMGAKALGIMGGTLDLHGVAETPWSRLVANAPAGATQILVPRASAWKVGHRIVLASTDFNSGQAEERTITAAAAVTGGTRLTLDSPLAHPHWGTVHTIDGRAVDQRGEVGLLTRNITVEGEAATSADGFGGQIMVMPGSVSRINNVELTRMGQKNVLRRYPLHFHMMGDASSSYLYNSVVHKSFNRCITVHGTNKVTLYRNVCHDHLGHGVFFEDGAETGNVLDKNLVLTTRKPASGERLLPSEANPGSYWITNPGNIFRGNVAAGSEGHGFWFGLPEHPTGLSATTSMWPRRIPLGGFTNNVAHSNNNGGLHADDGPRSDGTTESTQYSPVTDPADAKSAPVVARFIGMRAWKNRQHGVWLRGDNHRVEKAVLSDNGIGVTFASTESFLADSLVVGETANVGKPQSWEATGEGGRSLPRPWQKELPIRGFEFYDGLVGVERTTFANFRPTTLRKAGGIGFLLENKFQYHAGNYAAAVRFVNAVNVYVPDPKAGFDGDTSAVFLDTDGSVTGTAGRHVVAKVPFLLNNSCSLRADWNAHVCTADYATLWSETLDSNPAAVKPLTVRRSDGATQTLVGSSAGAKVTHTTVPTNAAYTVDFTDVDGKVTPDRTKFVLWRGPNRWLRLTIDYPVAPKVTKYGCDVGDATSWCRAPVTSLAELDASTKSTYWYDSTAKKVHLKLVSTSSWEELIVAPR